MPSPVADWPRGSPPGFMAKGAALAAMFVMPSPEDEEKTMLDHYWEIPDYYKENPGTCFVFNVQGKKVAASFPKEREWAPISRLYEKLWQTHARRPRRIRG